MFNTFSCVYLKSQHVPNDPYMVYSYKNLPVPWIRNGCLINLILSGLASIRNDIHAARDQNAQTSTQGLFLENPEFFFFRFEKGPQHRNGSTPLFATVTGWVVDPNNCGA